MNTIKSIWKDSTITRTTYNLFTLFSLILLAVAFISLVIVNEDILLLWLPVGIAVTVLSIMAMWKRSRDITENTGMGVVIFVIVIALNSFTGVVGTLILMCIPSHSKTLVSDI
ncbi:DUF805 domain-containing protein [Vibrio genomosp. F10]|uniref:DUF805 domain-containing protein n=1 Tax=Vibrio genomosp. F10 TaxID=723171 RepID=UPI0002D9A152|nr:DUF805 domain-containing protein [Vibrio genomosp. F10]OEF06039.1 hypothetical protein A1QI_07140 [Vibrio genomosp. F10 str. 9ZB36]